MAQEIIAVMLKNSVQAARIDPSNVFQVANLANRLHIDKLLGQLITPGSQVAGMENILELARRAQAGQSCLILMEHYSNFDIPNFFYLMEQHSADAKAAVNQIIAMAGAKLNEETNFARAFAEAYSRIVIYPSRSLSKLKEDGPTAQEEVMRARSINMAALHEMVRHKHKGNIVLVFPSGTRYRPGHDQTKRGLKEIDSYIKSFDHLLLIGIAGNTLRPNPNGDMTKDMPFADKVVFYADTILDTKEFRTANRGRTEEDPKQAVADAVMAELERIHVFAENIRLQA